MSEANITKPQRRTGYQRLSARRRATLIKALQRDALVATCVASGLTDIQTSAELDITIHQARRSRERAFERAARAVVIPLAPIIRADLIDVYREAIVRMQGQFAQEAGPAAVSAAVRAGQELAKILGLYAQPDNQGDKHLHITIGVPEADRTLPVIDSPSVKLID